MNVLKPIFYLRQYLFPFGCSLCGTSLLDVSETWYGLCHTCSAGIEGELDENRAGEFCDYCGKPLVSEHDRCLSCRNGETYAFDRAYVLFPYTGKYQRLLAAYKFQKNIALGNFFAGKIYETLKQHDLPAEARIVPVPPRPGKIRKAAWDQVEYIAKLLEKKSGIPKVNRCLRRLAATSQKKLGRENRRTNLRGRIVPVRQVPQTAILIDDVMTTGSTLDACAAALKEGGAQTVYGLCLFYD